MTQPRKPPRRAICPTCHRKGAFTFSGTQQWPEVVASSVGMPRVLTLWTCPHCHTTLSDLELLPAVPMRIPVAADTIPGGEYAGA